jgi:NAD(P)-dependent dehydrogenase (short-subunit alcohol dehydrogenase family)
VREAAVNGLRDRPFLVTGAASGIGRSTCERLVAEGARVAMLDRDADLLATAARDLGSAALPLVVDVSQEEPVRDAIARAAATLGGLRGVVTSAGIFRPGDMQRLADVDVETFVRTIAVNLTGTFLVVKYALPHLVREGGSIVTIASTAALRGHGFGSGYTASKGGVVALTRLLAFQYGDDKVRANCVCPGATDTPMTGGVYHQPERAKAMARVIPLRRVAQPEEIGNTACYLLSDDSSYLNGQVIAVDGGATVM